jgi:predicted Holliday junction resolvase-like endonuclease
VKQFLMTASCFPNFFGFTSFYVFLVTIACSQLEKLKADILDIRQKLDTSEQDSGAETDREEEETQVQISQEAFCRMQEQLNDCIRHHQDILRCVTKFCGLKCEVNTIQNVIYVT